MSIGPRRKGSSVRRTRKSQAKVKMNRGKAPEDERAVDMSGFEQRLTRQPEEHHRTRKNPKDMPKRPLSAYNLFFRDARERMKQSHVPQGLRLAEISRVIASQWKTLDEERKNLYERQAEEERRKYYAALREWEASKNQELKAIREGQDGLQRENEDLSFQPTEMDHMLTTIDELQSSSDNEFVSFVSSLGFPSLNAMAPPENGENEPNSTLGFASSVAMAPRQDEREPMPPLCFASASATAPPGEDEKDESSNSDV